MKKLIIIKMKFIAHLSRKLKGKKGNKIQYFCSVSFSVFPSIWFLFTYWGLMKFEKLWFDIFSLYPSVLFHSIFLFIYSSTGPDNICKIQFSDFTIRKKSKKDILMCVDDFCVKLEVKNKQIWFYRNLIFWTTALWILKLNWSLSLRF